MRSLEVDVSKTTKFIIQCNINRGERTKLSSPPNTNRFYYTLLLPLLSQYFQLRPRRRGRMGDKPDKVASSLSCEGKSEPAPEGREGTLKTYIEGGTASVDREGVPTKLVYLTFYPSGMSTINWKKLDQELESNKASRGGSNKRTKSLL